MKQTIKNALLHTLSLSISLSGAFAAPAYAANATNIVSKNVSLTHEITAEEVENVARSVATEGVLDDEVFSGASVPVSTVAPQDIAPMSKEDILVDKGARIADEFAVPKGLEKRVSFWFDIYTKYSDKTHVIHHVLYPWIVFKVVDTTPIYESNLHKWTKYHKARKFVSTEIANVRLTLRKLAKRKSFNNLKGLEKEIFAALAEVKGPRQKVLRQAANNMRVQLGQRDFFLSGLTSSAKYLPYMEQEFKAIGLPTELARLPFVESSFNEKAHSKVGASGIWQIMPVTGRAYFRVNDNIDERNSPLKASLAAADIFRTNYKQLKDWPLAVTAYNHGVGGLKSNLRKGRASNLPDLIAKYHAGSFKFASANFYTCFLAVVHAERYHQEIFAKEEIIRNEPMLHHVFALKSPIRINKVIQLTGLDKESFLTYNMDLKNAAKKNIQLPSGFKVLLPPIAKRNLETNLGPSLMKEADNMTLNKPGKKRRG